MIVAMKKLSILALASRKKELALALRGFGALHLDMQERASSSLDSLRESASALRQAIRLIPGGRGAAPAAGATGGRTPEGADLEEAAGKVAQIAELGDALRECEGEMEILRREISRIEDWGNFDPSLFSALFPYIPLSLAVLSRDELKRLPEAEGISYMILAKKKNSCRLLFIGDTAAAAAATALADIDFFRLPDRSLHELQKELEACAQKSDDIREELGGFRPDAALLGRYLESLERDIEFASVQANMGELEDLPLLLHIEGFIPADRLDDFGAFAASESIAFIAREPAPEDTVPTFLRNSRAVRITEPIFAFMDTLPGYREHDISFWFLIFFVLFFAMIIGDAGYGLLLSLTSLGAIMAAKIKGGRSRGAGSGAGVPNVLILFATLGLGTLFWGAVSGNWFGYAPIGDIPFFRQFIIPRLDAFAEGIMVDAVVETLLIFCFSIGLCHLLLAHILSAVKKFREAPRVHGLADLGWIATMLGLYFFVLNLVVDADKFPVPPFTLPLILGGLLAVLLFDGQQGDGFFRGLGRTLNIGNLIHTALTAISSFADVISYIRLFAVGLASVEIAKSFNNMAEGIMQGGGLALIPAIIVLCIGHSLNIVMGGLSVLVHGLRLKMLEFSGHLGNEWTGMAYKPFRDRLLKN